MTTIQQETKMEDLWDMICVQIGFNKDGKEIQKAIKNFCEMKISQDRGETMGVSQWREIGKRLGYWDYFVKESQKELIGKIRKLRERFKCAACYGAHCGHTQCCQALSQVLSLIKPNISPNAGD